MPNYRDAPWNAPVEDEGRELSDSDIPTRRRKPGEKKEDVLTELIFGSFQEPKKVKKPSVFAQKITPDNVVIKDSQKSTARPNAESKKIESSQDRRTRLLNELAQLEEKEKKISASLRTFDKTEKKKQALPILTKPANVVLPAPLFPSKKGGRTRVTSSSFKSARSPISSSLAKIDGVQKEPPKRISAAIPIIVPARTPQVPKSSNARPQKMDGIAGARAQTIIEPKKEPKLEVAQILNATPQVEQLQVDPAITPILQPVTTAASAQTLETEQKIYDYYTKDHTHPKKRRFVRQIAVVAVAFLLAAGVLGIVDGERLPGSFAFLSNISGFLRNSTFALSVENKQTFPELVQLYGATQVAREQFEGSKELEELSESLEKFFSSNSTFTWRSLFNGGSTKPSNVAELGNVLKQKKLFEAAHEHVLLLDSNSLTETVSWISFLSELYGNDGSYLVLTLNEAHSTPIGGEPMFYSVVKFDDGKAQIVKSGSAKDLNAALTTKIIPPKAVQGVKTDLDLYEAGWLYTFDDAAQLITLMYEQTTQDKIDGVIVVTKEAAGSIMGDKNSSATLSDTWLSNLFEDLAENAELEIIGGRLKEEFARGALQASFEQNTFSTFARGKLNLVAETETIDSLSVSARAWEGEGVQVSMLEYSPHFYGDGSIVGNATVNIKNLGDSASRAYVKFYIPQKSMILEAQGYSQKVSPAPFDYADNGFAQHALIERLNERVSDEFVQVDMYDEGELLVVGGWVSVPAAGVSTAKLSYRISSRLDWRAGNARYDFTALPISAGRDVPFKFVGVLDEGVTFDWKEPLGHVAQQTTEFQKTLSSVLKLSSSINFTSGSSNEGTQ